MPWSPQWHPRGIVLASSQESWEPKDTWDFGPIPAQEDQLPLLPLSQGPGVHCIPVCIHSVPCSSHCGSCYLSWSGPLCALIPKSYLVFENRKILAFIDFHDKFLWFSCVLCEENITSFQICCTVISLWSSVSSMEGHYALHHSPVAIPHTGKVSFTFTLG